MNRSVSRSKILAARSILLSEKNDAYSLRRCAGSRAESTVYEWIQSWNSNSRGAGKSFIIARMPKRKLVCWNSAFLSRAFTSSHCRRLRRCVIARSSHSTMPSSS
uniref:Uncharacterized protein n=1 Tax=Globisporangium ultimum (strain ATCC 200006 / CBS 805.95 / DAOM BR144) TaxID=431595 RepID=K3WQN1_GLOUD